MSRNLMLSLLAACALVRVGPVLAQEGQKKVLVVYATRRDSILATVGDRELSRLLDQGLERRLDYYTEYIDVARFPDGEYERAFRDFLRQKYGELRFDLVVAIEDASVEFVRHHRNELFLDTPVVFFTLDRVAALENATGVVARLDFAQTIALATTLQPDTNEVVVIGGASPRDRFYESLARAAFKQFEGRLTFTYLTGLAIEDYESRLKALPPHSIVYYALVSQDGRGRNYRPREFLERIAPVTSRPIYSWDESTMDYGVVGGSLRHLEGGMAAVAERSLRVLAGTPADSIAPAVVDLGVLQVDWRQLAKWSIDESRVPPGTDVKFRDPGIWELYRVYIVGGLAVLLAQTALIAGLLVQAVRRRRAEELVNRNQAELRRSHQRISDLGGRLLSAQEAERSRIARELHDDVSQQVALLAMDLQILSGSPHEASDEERKLAREALERAHAIARSVHDLSHRLHPAKLRLIGIVGALRSLQRTWPQTDIALTFSDNTVPSSLPDDLTLCLYRVVQEALQNAVKHSGAREIAIRLAGTPRGLTLSIVDDGRGFDVDKAWGSGLGLASMNERLESIGGSLSIHSAPGAGTRLDATVPQSAITAMAQAAALSTPK